MKILVWGFGNYYKNKESSFLNDTILAFVSSQETGKYSGIDIISSKDISYYQYEKLYIMAGPAALFEILDELNRLKYQEWEKVVFGWDVEPFTEDESILFEDGGKIKYNPNTKKCIYFLDTEVTELANERDFIELKQKRVREQKKNEMLNISIEPTNRIFGLDRGKPIERYYIEKFLSDNSSYIKGAVMEVADSEYITKYGNEVEKKYIMHVCESIGDNGIIANLETGLGVTEGLVDCFILTQTLPFIFDVRSAARNVVRFLKSKGVALVTVSGIVQISRYDMDRWGHYWSFTTASLRKLFEECDDVESVEIKAYGNAKSAVYGLYGLAVEDMNIEDLEYQDDDYQQMITAVVKKR